MFLRDQCHCVFLTSILNQIFVPGLEACCGKHMHTCTFVDTSVVLSLCAALWFSLLLLPPFCALNIFSFRRSLFFCFIMSLKTSLSIQNGCVSVEGGLLATSNLSSFVILERKKAVKIYQIFICVVDREQEDWCCYEEWQPFPPQLFQAVCRISIHFFHLFFWSLFSDGFNRGVFRERIHTSSQKCYVFTSIVIGTRILFNVGRSE